MKQTLIISILMLYFATCSFAQDINYVSKNNDWDADSLGNQRVVLTIENTGAKIAFATIDWRRNDLNPENKKIIFVDSTTNQIVKVELGSITRETGLLYFEPVKDHNKYFVYYLPYKVDRKSNYPNIHYLKSELTANKVIGKAIPNFESIEQANVEAIESINGANSNYPMEVIAFKREVDNLVNKSGDKPYLVFPEDRLNAIRMKHDLPQRWIKTGARNKFTDVANLGENFSWQLGVYPISQNLEDVNVSFSDFKNPSGQSISSGLFSCMNTSGINYKGELFKKRIDVKKGDVQAFWCLVNIPENIPEGEYTGIATITAKGTISTEIAVALKVKSPIIKNNGIDAPEKLTRLTWLNSTLAQKNEVIKPYIPLIVKGSTIEFLGRKLVLGDNGFPQKIETYFTKEMTSYSKKPKQVINSPISFNAETIAGMENWQSGKLKFTKIDSGTVRWEAVSTTSDLKLDINGSLEFDGFTTYNVKVTALQDVDLKDVSMDIPFNKEAAKYMMGLNQKGGNRPISYDWKWDVANKNQDGAWIGDVNAGLQYSLRDENYVRPLNTNFYLQKPLLLPTSWGNNNKGGINISEKENTVLVRNYSGQRILKKGDVLYYNFTLLITPFHPLNTDFQWETRFFHKYDSIDSIKAKGATVVNIHHATPINPFINYPFIAYPAMKAYIDEAHQKGLKVKIYNTVRELSNSAYETFAMRSLGNEIYSSGKGGGYSWLQEHLGDDYIAAWYVPEIKDAAILNSGMSRWHNYYVEGMNWLVQNVGIDGIYLDDVAFDRITMKRIKRVLTQNGHPGIIDLHSANQYNKNDGFNNSANLYMEHFPYLDRLWFGEYFDYENNSPDFFLTEVSGIPFGLMGEMLQGGGNPWRGMVYGMTNRMPWSDNADPRPIWKVWDDFGIKGSSMIGYWVDDNPVKTDNSKVPVTIYKKENKVLVALASWATEDTKVKLVINWKKLGIDPSKATIVAPEIKNFQSATTFKVDDDINIPKGKGLLLIIN